MNTQQLHEAVLNRLSEIIFSVGYERDEQSAVVEAAAVLEAWHKREKDPKVVVVALFNAALKLAEDESNYESDVLSNAENAAFNAAQSAGWDWSEDRHFTDWCLKATNVEILTEGKKRFLKLAE